MLCRQRRTLTDQEVAQALGGLPPIKMHCSVLAHDAIKAAVADYKKNLGQAGMAEKVQEERLQHEQEELLRKE